MKPGVECSSADAYLGNYGNEWECAEACHLNGRCNYFIYGPRKGKKEGDCYWEKTQSRECSGINEEFESDDFNFYEILGI